MGRTSALAFQLHQSLRAPCGQKKTAPPVFCDPERLAKVKVTLRARPSIAAKRIRRSGGSKNVMVCAGIQKNGRVFFKTSPHIMFQSISLNRSAMLMGIITDKSRSTKTPAASALSLNYRLPAPYTAPSSHSNIAEQHIFLPSPFALYKAASAAFIRERVSSFCVGIIEAAPTLTVTCSETGEPLC